MQFASLPKLKKGDKVAVLSPSFAAPGKWPHVYELGLQRLRKVFELEPVEFPTTKKLGATTEERSKDLIDAFENPEIKAVIATIGGNDQVTYIKNLPTEVFCNNPKPFFGHSDNSHFINHLWLCGVPSYYGGSLFTQFAFQNLIPQFTLNYLLTALTTTGPIELEESNVYNDIGLNWNDPETLNQSRLFEPNEGWYWDGIANTEGITWGGCLESIDEMLRHGISLPTLEQFENVILFTETSEEIPNSDYVFRVYRALGERGILARVKAVLVGRPQAWEFTKPNTTEEKILYKAKQRETINSIVRKYNPIIPIVQNMDFGHTDPQIPLPVGRRTVLDSTAQKITIDF